MQIPANLISVAANTIVLASAAVFALQPDWRPFPLRVAFFAAFGTIIAMDMHDLVKLGAHKKPIGEWLRDSRNRKGALRRSQLPFYVGLLTVAFLNP